MSDLNLNNLTDAQKRLFAVRCARRVQHLMTDPRSVAALDVAERYANGEATDDELAAASAAALAARAAVWDAWASAAAAASRAAWTAASAAASDAAAAAAWAVARAAAGSAQARDAVRDAAWNAERIEQQGILEQIRKEAQS